MFNNQYGLENAVLRGDKTRTWRADKKPRYKVGEIVAIKQSYQLLATKYSKHRSFYNKLLAHLHSPGWNNKMYVCNDMMPHHIRITKVTPFRLQDITEEECLREGIHCYQQGNDTYYNCTGIYIKGHPGVLKPFKSPIDAFFMLINKLNGWGYWNQNPSGYAYEFELTTL